MGKFMLIARNTGPRASSRVLRDLSSRTGPRQSFGPRSGQVGAYRLDQLRIVRLGLRPKTPHRAIRRDQEFFEVPLDVPGLARAVGHLGQLDIERMPL